MPRLTTPDNPIRVFVIGGLTGESPEGDKQMADAAKSLGHHLGASPDIQIVVCSAHRSSVDAGVIEGFASRPAAQPGRVIIHHPLDARSGLAAGESISDQWASLIKRTGLAKPHFRQNSDAKVSEPSGFSNAFLLCQIRALREDTDIVVVLGGKRDASAAQLLAIARGNYPIVPFAFLGGAGEQEYLRQEASIRSLVNDQELADALQSSAGVDRVLELINKIRRSLGRHHVFMSYSWKRKEEADFVEAFLRRDPKITLFRDEEEIKTGEPISERIKLQLTKCDVFLVLWCAEYTASPNCYDELHIASKRKDCVTYVLRLDDTRPVWPALRKARSHEWEKKWIPPGEGEERRKAITAGLHEMLNILSKVR
jgi:hypothetical protein